MATVVNRKYDPYDVYIGRGTPWGNPFTLQEYSRERCLQMYRKYMIQQLDDNPDLVTELLKLKDKRLGCSCKPLSCHGDVLLDLIKRYS